VIAAFNRNVIGDSSRLDGSTEVAEAEWLDTALGDDADEGCYADRRMDATPAVEMRPFS